MKRDPTDLPLNGRARYSRTTHQSRLDHYTLTLAERLKRPAEMDGGMNITWTCQKEDNDGKEPFGYLADGPPFLLRSATWATIISASRRRRRSQEVPSVFHEMSPFASEKSLGKALIGDLARLDLEAEVVRQPKIFVVLLTARDIFEPDPRWDRQARGPRPENGRLFPDKPSRRPR